MSLLNCLIVMAGGALGTLARYLLSVLAQPVSRDLPWGTILINVAGSFVIGTLSFAQGRYPLSEGARLFVMVGICGGFTTFSSFSLQTLELMRAGAMLRAGLNIALSVLLCLAAVAIGHALATHLNGGRAEIARISTLDDA
jgi:CrcB protein